MLWAAQLEAKILDQEGLAQFIDARVEVVGVDELTDFVEKILDDKDYVTSGELPDDMDEFVTTADLDRRLENDLPDMDDYVQKDDLKSEVEEMIEDTDLVQDVVRGAVQEATRTQRELLELRGQLNQLQKDHLDLVRSLEHSLIKFQKMTPWQRFRWAFSKEAR